MVSLRLARGDLKFRVNAKNDDSKCAFKHMVHVDAQCNLSCSCARQKQDRTSPQRKHMRSINLEIILFYRDFCISLFFQVLEKRNFKNFRNFYRVLSTLFFFTFGVEGAGEFRSLSNPVFLESRKNQFQREE